MVAGQADGWSPVRQMSGCRQADDEWSPARQIEADKWSPVRQISDRR